MEIEICQRSTPKKPEVWARRVVNLSQTIFGDLDQFLMESAIFSCLAINRPLYCRGLSSDPGEPYPVNLDRTQWGDE
jgi:hypothetical protein